MKKLLFSVLILLSLKVYSQIEKKFIAFGEMVIVTGEKITFKNLSWKDDKAYFTNVSNNEAEQLYEASIKSIEEKELPPQVTTNTNESNLYKPNYPEGIYKDIKEFTDKKPSSNPHLTKRALFGFEKKITDDNDPNCFFFNTNEEKIKNVFAVVYHGVLYFNIKAILNNHNEKDRAQDSDFPNSFVRVLTGGKNYLYTQVVLQNVWAKGLAYGAAGQGGAIGGAGIAGTMILDNSKGVVWDFKNHEFNIFKNCKDYNEFIKDISPEDVQECTNSQPNNAKVQIAIDKIK